MMSRMLAALILAIAAVAAPLSLTTAQQHVRVDGTVLWISGNTLTLRTDVPSAPGYQIYGQYLVPVPGSSLNVSCDLRQLAQSDYAYMRPGERVSVIGVMSRDGRHLVATSIIRDADQQAP
jgi:hypothetical protein